MIHIADSSISEDDMDLEMHRIDANASGKRKACEVEFESLTQDAIERLIRKDIDHICSIFSIPVRNCSVFGAVINCFSLFFVSFLV